MDGKALQAFCSTDENRYHIQKPWSRGVFTYATNGHILVRVARLADVAEDPEAPNCQKVIDAADPMTILEPLVATLPAPFTNECTDCEGNRDPIHDCPQCDCMCETCGGSGSYELKTSCSVAGAFFDVKYIRMILTFPSLRFPVTPSKSGPSYFEFDGGIGCLMPLRTSYGKHIGDLRPTSAEAR